MSVLVAARTLGELSAWQLTNLQIQKVLYIAQMLHLGRTGEPLFSDRFEAWELGPVVPRLYRELKGYRSNVVAGIDAPSVFAFGTSQAFAIDDAFVMTQHMSAGQLVTFTHRPGGAWELNFRQGEKGCIIPTDAILTEPVYPLDACKVLCH